MGILIQDNGIISVNGKNLAQMNWKDSDCVSKKLVLAANAVRIAEKAKKK